MRRSAIGLAALALAFLACMFHVPARADGESAAGSAAPQIPPVEAATPLAEPPIPMAEAVALTPAEPADRSAEYPDGLAYTVVEGDTLWDLSAKYLGSPGNWPVLWERNRFLTNPHYIYPGVRLEIFPSPEKQYAAQPPAVPAAVPAEAPKPPAETPPPAPAAREIVRLLDIKPADYVCAGEFVRDRPRGIGAIARAD